MKYTYLVVGIIVVILVVAAFSAVRDRLPRIGQNSNNTQAPVAEEVIVASLSAGKHTPASSAVIDKAMLTQNGFIVVYDDQNGSTGGVLGVSNLLQAGTHENLVITLSRKTVDGEKLHALIQNDNGDGVFDALIDETSKDTSGNAIQTQFDVAAIASGTADFQIPATGLGEDDR